MNAFSYEFSLDATSYFYAAANPCDLVLHVLVEELLQVVQLVLTLHEAVS